MTTAMAIVPKNYTSLFVAPGLRLKFAPAGRISPWVAFGCGYALYWAFDKAAFALGAIDVLNKQLMALAVALTTQCPYCITLHVKSAREGGATDQMLAETATVAAAMRAGAVITHATHLFQD